MRHLWIEVELSNLTKLISVIDEQLSDICRESVKVEDADSFGYFDSAEHAVGLGLVACQTYMAAVYGEIKLEKNQALEFGPKHHGGLTKVQIINHAANYWKHSNEWALDRSAKRREAIELAFDSVGFSVGAGYPLFGILTELTDPYPASLQPIISILETWKAELQNEYVGNSLPLIGSL